MGNYTSCARCEFIESSLVPCTTCQQAVCGDCLADNGVCYDCACTHCMAAKAVHFTEAGSDYDPVCEACFHLTWCECDNCGAIVDKGDVGERMVYRGSRESPPEYDTCCIRCAPERGEPDYDSINDSRRDDGEGW
jgi:hypothetical protein